jgi:hypothetical protein
VLFTAFAAVNLNDPDPGAWVAVYLLAAALGAALALGRGPGRWAWLPALLAGAWALSLVPAAREAPLAGVFTDWQMVAPGVEEGRELLGLVLVAAWCAWLATRRP